MIYRFGTFEASPANNSLTRRGVKIKIQDQPFQLLLALLERAGAIVTREELRQKLWPEGTYVDFDGSLNAVLKRLRSVLDDDSGNPTFVETVPRQGYRFIAPVAVIRTPVAQREAQPISLLEDGLVEPSAAREQAPALEHPKVRWAHVAIALGLLAVLVAGWDWHRRSLRQQEVAAASVQALPLHVRRSAAVVEFRNLSGRGEDAWLATAIAEMMGTELAVGDQIRLAPGEDVADLKATVPWPEAGTLDRATSQRLGNALNSDMLVLGSYTVIGKQLRVDVRVQDSQTGEILVETAETGAPQELFALISRMGGTLRQKLGIQSLEGGDEAAVVMALPSNAEASRLFAVGLEKLRQFDALAAKDLLLQAEKADPKFPMVHLLLAEAWGQLGYEQKRKEEAKKALDLTGDLPRAQQMLIEGEYQSSLGNQDQAASIYRALFELYPDNLDYGLRLAGIEGLLGKNAQAREVIRRLRGLPLPLSCDPRIDLTEARVLKDDKPVVLALIRSAVKKANDRRQKMIYALAKKEECNSLQYGEKPASSIPSCEEAYNVFLGAGNRPAAADALRIIADEQGTEGKYKDAIASYQRALDALSGLGEHEKTGAVFNNMAIVFTNLGDLSRAEQLYRSARGQFEETGDVINEVTAVGNIADILFLRGNLAGAEKVYREALRMNGETEDGGGYLLYRMADLQLTRGQVREARQLAQQSVDVERAKHGDYQYLTAAMLVMGEAMEAQDDLAGARAQFEQALAMRKGIGAQGGQAECQMELAQLSIEEGHPAAAEPLLREAVAEFEREGSDPSGSSALTLLSRALLMQGKLDEAQKTVQRGAQLSLTSSDPALRLPAEIQQARVEMAVKSSAGAHESSGPSSALSRLQTVIATARSLGYYNIEEEARLAAAELQLPISASSARKQLTQLAAEARGRGFEQTAREAEQALAARVQAASLSAH